jgi:hypothetical protein
MLLQTCNDDNFEMNRMEQKGRETERKSKKGAMKSPMGLQQSTCRE